MSTNAARSTRVFFYLVYVVLGFIWVGSMAVPTWREPHILIPFSVLMVIHGLLHGLTERIETPSWSVLFLVLQTTLAVTLVLLGGGGALVGALFAPLAGEAVGLFRHWPGRTAGLCLVTGGWMLAMVLSDGLTAMIQALPWTAGAFGFASIYVVLYLRQNEERQRAESLLTQLEVAHHQLRDYARQVEELTVTEERHRMARELHDTLAQGLAGLIMQLEAADDLLDRGDGERARTVVQKAMERARQTLVEARATIHALREPVERGDLVEEIQQELDRARVEGGLHVRFEVGPHVSDAEQPTAQHLYRIVQEGLANVVRHARAHTVTVGLWSKEEQLCLSIVDDGIGFDPAAEVKAGHFGLIGVAERVRLLGGTFQLDSHPGRGTRLIISVPKGHKGREGAR